MKVVEIATVMLLVSVSFQLVDVVGVDEAWQAQQSQPDALEESTERISEKQDSTEDGIGISQVPGASVFYAGITVGIEFLQTILGIPTAVYDTISLLVPEPYGAPVGAAIQIPVDFFMLIGLAQFLRGYGVEG